MLFIISALALLIVVLRAIGGVSTAQFEVDDWLLLSLIEILMSYLFIKTNFIGIRLQLIPDHDTNPGRTWNYGIQALYDTNLALFKATILVFLLKLYGQKDSSSRCIYSHIRQRGAGHRSIAYESRVRPRQRCWFVFLLGFLVTITSVVHLTVLLQDLFGLPGFEGRVGLGFVTPAIEIYLTLITASAPALRPLFHGKSWHQLPDVDTRMADDKGGTRGGSRRGSRKAKADSVTGHPDDPAQRHNEPSLVWDNETELRRRSPRRSRQKTMTSSNGTIRLSDVQREIDVLVMDLIVGPGGSYLLKRPTGYEERESEQQQFRGEMEQLEREVRCRQQAAAPRQPPSGANFSSYAAGVVRAVSSQAGPRISPRPRTRDRDFSEEPKSKYGDKRNGVITPREPSAPAWPF
ncbi:uncharacterized protein PgNI_09456 [Pyricularia grisea]|uniref:Uncharacterized protein n=1 Tax=Pyricularia grisea TaxID=148305 RepID=A0A6P8AT10_PYRGI|nr:uncharacterized protein PgNI_09456 [Pyricularia grisea]TLD05248.1 hypothetical protein PgNI_09456 [Pyricularia grisea]